MVKKEYDYKYLHTLKDDGYNLQIIGYDGYNLQIIGYDGFTPSDDLYSHYIDPSRPFGHELVLHTMLVIPSPVSTPGMCTDRNILLYTIMYCKSIL
jgi:hypothetical protein